MSIRRVSDLADEPKPGRYYLVPCVQSPRRAAGWIPVILPAHDDPELAILEAHYHYDRRFTPAYRGAASLINKAESAVILTVNAHTPVELRRKKCQRRMPDFYLSKGFFERIERLNADLRLKPGCRTCPHRGVSLANLPVDAEGCVVCPGHGLKWHLESGQLISRVPEPAR